MDIFNKISEIINQIGFPTLVVICLFIQEKQKKKIKNLQRDKKNLMEFIDKNLGDDINFGHVCYRKDISGATIEEYKEVDFVRSDKAKDELRKIISNLKNGNDNETV